MAEILESRLIHENKDRTIHLEHHITEEVVTFLDRIRFGYKDTTLYHKNTREIIHQMKDPYVFTARIRGQIAMMCLFSKREFQANGKTFDAFYVRYLAADHKVDGMGSVVKIGLETIAWLRKTREKPTLFYSYVEESHKASYRFIEKMKFFQFADIKTIGFSRYFPKVTSGVEQVKKIQSRPELIQLLKSKFNNHTTFDLDDLMANGDYYILKIDNEIIAGLRTGKANWALTSLPGIIGKLAINLVPYIPIVNRIIDPKDWHFYGMDGLFCKDGHAEDLIKLMSSALALNNMNSALLWLDNKDPLAHQLIDSKNLGLAYHFAKSSNAKTMLAFENMTTEEESYFKNNMNYISALDNL